MLSCLAFVPTRYVDMLEKLLVREYQLFFPVLASPNEELARRWDLTRLTGRNMFYIRFIQGRVLVSLRKIFTSKYSISFRFYIIFIWNKCSKSLLRSIFMGVNTVQLLPKQVWVWHWHYNQFFERSNELI